MTAKLTDARLRTLKPTERTQKLADGGGLYIELTPQGSKLWRLAYRFDGKQKKLALGKYPETSLADARNLREQAKALLAKGIDPSTEKKRVKVEVEKAALADAMTFERVASEWLEKRGADKTERYRKELRQRLENHILPHIPAMPFSELEAQDFLAPLRIVEARGSLEMAHRLAQIIKQVARFAKVSGYSRHNEAADIGEALQKRGAPKHMAAIVDPRELGGLLRAVASYNGDISTRYALRLMPYVFVRSSELRGAKWAEFDLEKRQWVIPAERMKMRIPHIVPLSSQVMRLLGELHEWTGNGALLFPGLASKTRPITDMALLNALRRMGYARGVMTIHGFRATASTLLNEQGYRREVIEAQLAHKERDKVREAYNHASYLPEREKMLQEWADYLDELKTRAVEI